MSPSLHSDSLVEPNRDAPAAPALASRRVPPILSNRQRIYLRGLGHHLDPVVTIGKEGINGGLLGALDGALDQHELLKLRIGENAPGERRELAESVAEHSGAALVQVIGRTMLLYRRRPDRPKDDRPHLRIDPDDDRDRRSAR